jgi:hypothetical protein
MRPPLKTDVAKEKPMRHKQAIANRILKEISRFPGCSLEDLTFACPSLTWNQVFIEIDRLSRDGILLLERTGPGMYIRHRSGKRSDLKSLPSPSMKAKNMPLSSKKAGPASKCTKSGAECAHERVVDYEFSEDGEKTGPFARNAGLVFPKKINDPTRLTELG